jgi:hypothetical protein
VVTNLREINEIEPFLSISNHRTVHPGTSLIAAGTAQFFFVDFLVFFSESGSMRNSVLCILPKFSHGVSLFWAEKVPKLSAIHGHQYSGKVRGLERVERFPH